MCVCEYILLLIMNWKSNFLAMGSPKFCLLLIEGENTLLKDSVLELRNVNSYPHLMDHIVS